MRAEPIVIDTADATLQLLAACQQAVNAAVRRFVLLNRSREVWPYQLAVLAEHGRAVAHSGASSIDAHSPYTQWLEKLIAALKGRDAQALQAADLPEALREGWHEYWPPYLLWLPDSNADTGWLLARELPWTDRETLELHRWWHHWHHESTQAAKAARAQGATSWIARLKALRQGPGARWKIAALVGALAVLLFPVRLTLRAPGELVPRHPVVLRAAVDGTVRALKVEPNQAVRAGQVLAELDDAGWHGRLQVAQQALLTAEAEWRQVNQQVLNDARARTQLAAVQGKLDERRAEVAFLQQQVQRATLVAPQDGVVLIQEPGSWPGRTVTTGEAIMKLAQPNDQEVEAWLAVADAVDLPMDTPMSLHVSSHPGQPVEARLNGYAFEAEQRPDHGLGYRLRGKLESPADERLGARGTVKIEGPRVALAYWLLRRPLAALRETTGW